MKLHYLYKITNTVNGKMYIGITSRPNQRFKQHMEGKSSLLLKSAVAKYGVDAFVFEVLVIGGKDYIADLERKAISLYETQKRDKGYNIKPGGEVGLAGYSLKVTAKDKWQYASGFWFPNPRTAFTSLGIDSSTFKRRRKEGTLGDIVLSNLKGTWEGARIYVAGFWWGSVFEASENLQVSKEALKQRIKKGTLEQGYVVREQSGSNNHMFGISADKHPSSKRISVDGVIYSTIKEASGSTGISKYILTKRVKVGDNAFFLPKEE